MIQAFANVNGNLKSRYKHFILAEHSSLMLSWLFGVRVSFLKSEAPAVLVVLHLALAFGGSSMPLLTLGV